MLKLTSKNQNKLYFDTDDDFYEFCVVPKLVTREYINPAGETAYYVDFDFTPEYREAVECGFEFIMKDIRSQIIKHGNVVSYRTISKKVENLKSWIYEDDFGKPVKSYKKGDFKVSEE